MPTTLLNRPNTDSIVCRRNRPSLNRESVDEVVMYETNIFELLYPVYAIQPVWEPVEKRVGQPVECLYIHDTTGCPTGCQTGLTTGWRTDCIVYANVQPAVKPVAQPVVSCKRDLTTPATSDSKFPTMLLGDRGTFFVFVLPYFFCSHP